MALTWPRAAEGAALDRAVGCLLGQVIGDLLGSLVEFQPAAEIARAYPDGVRDLRDSGTWNTIAGQPTDDSELALALARALVGRPSYDAEAVAEAYGRWFASCPIRLRHHHRASAGRRRTGAGGQGRGCPRSGRSREPIQRVADARRTHRDLGRHPGGRCHRRHGRL